MGRATSSFGSMLRRLLIGDPTLTSRDTPSTYGATLYGYDPADDQRPRAIAAEVGEMPSMRREQPLRVDADPAEDETRT